MPQFDSAYFDAIHPREGTHSMKYGTPPAGAREDVLPMWVADMDFPAPPAVQEALAKTVGQKIYGYTSIDEGYWAILADWYRRRMGWEAETEWFLPTPNVLSGVAAALLTLTEPGDRVLLCEPVYYPFARIVRGLGRETVTTVLLDENSGYTVDYVDFERKIRDNHCKVFILCSPHNPVGRVWRREELAEMGRICCRHGVYIVSDEIHADLVYPAFRHIPMASVSEEIAARTVTCLAPTKTFNLAGLHMAQLIVSDDGLRAAIRAACSSMGLGTPNLMAIAAARAAYSEGEAWLDGLIRYLQGNLELLDSAFPAGAAVVNRRIEGTYLAWLDCRALGLDGEELEKLFLEKAGLWLDNGTLFGSGGEGFMRLNFACPRSVVQEAIDRLQRAVGM